MRVRAFVCVCVVPPTPLRGQWTVCEGLDLRQTGSQSLSSQQPTSLSATLAATKSKMFGPLCHFPRHKGEDGWGRGRSGRGCFLPSFQRSPPELQWRVFSPGDRGKRVVFFFFTYLGNKPQFGPVWILVGCGRGMVVVEVGRSGAWVAVVVVAADATPQDDSLYHSVVGAHGLLVTDAHGVLAPTRAVLLLPQRFPANGKRTFSQGEDDKLERGRRRRP